MGVVTLKSTVITNRDAVPRVHNSPYLENGQLRQTVATVAIATGDTSTSTYRLFQVPSNARISGLILYSDALGTATAGSLGLWDTTGNGGAVVSAALFASALDLHTAALSGVNEQFKAGVTLVSAFNAMEKRVWEILALASDPNKFYDVVLQLTTTCDAGGTFSAKLDYVI